MELRLEDVPDTLKQVVNKVHITQNSLVSESVNLPLSNVAP